MPQPEKRNPAGGPGFGGTQTIGRGLQPHHTAGPLGLVLDRLERVRRCGKGYTARCPAHPDKTASLSLAEGRTGAVVLHCFAGCTALEVVGALGLQLADLFPERLSPMDPTQRRELREYAKQSNWRAALNVLALEGTIVLIAAHDIHHLGGLGSSADLARLRLALDRITSAREVLHGR